MAWKPHLYRVGSASEEFDTPPSDLAKLRRAIEPWLSAVFQCEHLSLLLGSGFTTAVAYAVGADATGMAKAKLGCPLEDEINAFAQKSADAIGRGAANIEDQIRSALALAQRLASDRRFSSGCTRPSTGPHPRRVHEIDPQHGEVYSGKLCQ